MDRYISIPKNLVVDESIPEEAIILARTFSLETRVEEAATEIQIVSEPRIRDISYSEDYVAGRIWSLDIHDEFTDMSTSCFLKIDDEIFHPKINEKHIVKFRIRHKDCSKKQFYVYVNKKEYFSNSIYGK
jgi:hypothetical protein